VPRREFESQFSDGITEGTSFGRRPDAVSRSYLQALAPGPKALGDASEGLLVKGWYCRADNAAGKVYVCPARDDTSLGWGAEVEAFSYSGDDIDEISFAFDQNGAPFFAAERGGHVWIRYFDPGVPGFVFEDFGVGTTPRVVLDDPQEPTDSDLLVFYARASELRIREQSDLYVGEIDPGNGLSADQYIEGALRDGENRVHVIISTRNPGTGTYVLSRISSQLYPFYKGPESLDVRNRALSGEVLVVLINYTTEEESLDLGNSALSGTIQIVSFEVDLLDEASIVLSVEGVDVIVETILYTVADPEELDVGNSSLSGTLVVAAIHYDNAIPEGLDVGNSSLSGTLVVP
jgi:hypothetical protein